MTSTKDMLVTKGFKLKEMSDHPGNIMVIGYNRDMYIVNVYKMMVYKHFQYDLDGCIDCILKDKNLIICGK